ncbi:MAG: aspartate carbamoyltransferase regulatory subunit [Burkholderiales bacterium]|nr:aspartate carbamoyltransferase regulatory subunit [Burkholderiales bacterium]
MQNQISNWAVEDKKHIGSIENGINIDHIPCGNAFYIMKILNLYKSEYQTGIGLNLSSKKIGKKDLIKIENRELSAQEIQAISLFAVGSTLSILKDFKVIKKVILAMPDVVHGIIICPNKRCVSHHHVSQFLAVANRNNLIELKCNYCEKSFLLSDIKEYNL